MRLFALCALFASFLGCGYNTDLSVLRMEATFHVLDRTFRWPKNGCHLDPAPADRDHYLYVEPIGRADDRQAARMIREAAAAARGP